LLTQWIVEASLKLEEMVVKRVGTQPPAVQEASMKGVKRDQLSEPTLESLKAIEISIKDVAQRD